MQNIPSKAHDIRHLFRATPEQIETINVESDENDTITITLSKYDSVPSIDRLIEVSELKEDDIVIFKDKKKEIQYKVTTLTHNLGQYTIVLQKGE